MKRALCLVVAIGMVTGLAAAQDPTDEPGGAAPQPAAPPPAASALGDVIGTITPPIGVVNPIGLEHDGSGNFYLTDNVGNQVVLMDTTGAQISSFSVAANSPNPLGITTDGSSIYVTDASGQDVDIYALDGTYVSSFSVFAETPFPEGITYNPLTGNLYVVDGAFASDPPDSILEYTPGGTLVNQTILSTLSNDGIAFDPNRFTYWSYESNGDTVIHYDLDFSVLETFPGTNAAGYSDGEGVGVIGDSVYVAATSSNVIVEFDVTGAMTNYGLAMTITGNGATDPAEGVSAYNPGTVVNVTATPDAGWYFSHWEGDLTGSTNPTTITMDGHKAVTAVFVDHKLTTAVVGNGTLDPAPGEYLYADGASVTLTATAANGWTFSHWEGDLGGWTNPATITIDADKSITAVFTQQLPSVLLTLSVFGGGTTIPAPGEHALLPGSDVEVTAVPSAGWAFAGWSGDMTSTDNPLAFSIYADTSLTANFVQTGFACPFPQASAASPASPSSDVVLLAMLAATLLVMGQVRRLRRRAQ